MIRRQLNKAHVRAFGSRVLSLGLNAKLQTLNSKLPSGRLWDLFEQPAKKNFVTVREIGVMQ
jgi:hypothetical protein